MPVTCRPRAARVGAGTMPDGDLQVHPDKLDFTAAVGTDAPVTLTLFNPHPAERLAFKVPSSPPCAWAHLHTAPCLASPLKGPAQWLVLHAICCSP